MASAAGSYEGQVAIGLVLGGVLDLVANHDDRKLDDAPPSATRALGCQGAREVPRAHDQKDHGGPREHQRGVDVDESPRPEDELVR